MDGGTLYQLRNLINRRNIKKDPTSDVAASEDFFLLVVEAHIVSAAMTLFGMASLDDDPCETYFPSGVSELDTLQRSKVIQMAVNDVIDKFVDISFCERAKDGGETEDEREDCICSYACEVLTLGLLLMEFDDAIREGDGTRIIRCW